MDYLPLKIHKNRLLRYAVGAAIYSVLPLITGCFENYGRLKHNPEISQEFQIYQIEPNCTMLCGDNSQSFMALTKILPAI